MNLRYLIGPCTVYTGFAALPHYAVLVNGDRIEALLPAVSAPTDLPRRDGRGLHLCPGFVDLQLYGGGGVLFPATPTAEALRRLAAHLLRHGTTSFLPTMPTSAPEQLRAACAAVRDAQPTLPAVLGLHLEGPYLNAGKKGAHRAEYIQQATAAGVAELLREARGVLRYMTLAPECVPPEVARQLRLAGVVLSAGHSLATFDQATAAFNDGYAAATHLFNAMSGYEGRRPGLVGAVYDHAGVQASIIADGVHCDFATVRISQKLLGERLFLITDATEASTQGAYQFHREGNRFVDAAGTLAGSALTMPEAIANCVRQVGIPFEEALRMATLYPARLLGLDGEIGQLSPGGAANMCLLSNDYQVVATVQGGEWHEWGGSA